MDSNNKINQETKELFFFLKRKLIKIIRKNAATSPFSHSQCNRWCRKGRYRMLKAIRWKFNRKEDIYKIQITYFAAKGKIVPSLQSNLVSSKLTKWSIFKKGNCGPNPHQWPVWNSADYKALGCIFAKNVWLESNQAMGTLRLRGPQGVKEQAEELTSSETNPSWGQSKRP